MLSDLASTMLIASVALLLIAGALVWVGRGWAAGAPPLRGKLGVRPTQARGSRDAYVAGNSAAAVFMVRYGLIVAALVVLVVLLAFVSDVAALVLYLVALIFLGLGAFVCVRKAGAAAGLVTVNPPSEAEVGTTEAAGRAVASPGKLSGPQTSTGSSAAD